MLRDLDRAARPPCFTRGLVMPSASERLTLGSAFSPLQRLRWGYQRKSNDGRTEWSACKFDLVSGVAGRFIFAALRTTAVWIHTAAAPVKLQGRKMKGFGGRPSETFLSARKTLDDRFPLSSQRLKPRISYSCSTAGMNVCRHMRIWQHGAGDRLDFTHLWTGPSAK